VLAHALRLRHLGLRWNLGMFELGVWNALR
jgi:hypothetical protein